MQNRRLRASPLVLIAIVSLIAAGNPAPMESDAVGKTAPAFTVRDPLVDKNFSLSDYKDHVVMLQWMSPGECVPCNKQVEVTKKIIEKYKGKGLKSAAFIYRGEGERPELVKKCVKDHALTFDNYTQLKWDLYLTYAELDSKPPVKRKGGNLEFTKEPLMTCIIDAKGKVVFLAWDTQTEKAIDTALEKLLK